jgi:CO/xanthine dehydrogenase FAD-binding subunit
MKHFDYFAPTTLDHAVSLLEEYGIEARPLAGGTDLLIRMKRQQWTPRVVVNLKRIPGLSEITLDGELRLGGLVTLQDLIRSPIIRQHFPVLARTAAKMAGVQVRSLATVGGNLCNASPAADTAPPLLALKARVVIVGSQGERIIPLDQFFLGPGRTALASNEMLREIVVPRPERFAQASYLKLEHREAMDIAIAGVGIWLKCAEPKTQLPASKAPVPVCEDVRIALGAVAPTPMRARRAERVLRGNELTGERIRQAAQMAAEESQPIDDVRGSAWYRREMVEVLTRRQLNALKMGPGAGGRALD